MREFLLRLRLPLLLAVLVVLTLLSMLADRRSLAEGGGDLGWPLGLVLEVVAPIQGALLFPVDLARNGWTRYVELIDLRSESEELRARIAALEEANLQYSEALVASGHLQRIAQMRERFAVPLLPSEVVGHDVSPFFRSVLLDRGRSQGVRSGMPVVTDDGLVGLITATSAHASRTMLLLDRQSAVDAIVQRSRARGIVRGMGRGRLEFTLVVRGDDVEPGDVIVTSGVGGVHPKGLRIGTVGAVQAEESRVLHTASLRPAVDFGRLEQVFVMLERGPTMDLLYEGTGDVPGPPPDADETAG
jgi:rod shape-determining protein MreC